jgi:hypothetical protein
MKATGNGEVDVCDRILAAHSIPMFRKSFPPLLYVASFNPLADSMGLIMTTWAVRRRRHPLNPVLIKIRAGFLRVNDLLLRSAVSTGHSDSGYRTFGSGRN